MLKKKKAAHACSVPDNVVKALLLGFKQGCAMPVVLKQVLWQRMQPEIRCHRLSAASDSARIIGKNREHSEKKK